MWLAFSGVWQGTEMEFQHRYNTFNRLSLLKLSLRLKTGCSFLIFNGQFWSQDHAAHPLFSQRRSCLYSPERADSHNLNPYDQHSREVVDGFSCSQVRTKRESRISSPFLNSPNSTVRSQLYSSLPPCDIPYTRTSSHLIICQRVQIELIFIFAWPRGGPHPLLRIMNHRRSAAGFNLRCL